MIRGKFLKAVCLLLLPLQLLIAQPQHGLATRRGVAAANSANEAGGFSMMLWGVGLALGIGLLTGFLRQSTGGHSAHAHNNVNNFP